MNLLSYTICVLFICVGGILFDLAEFGMAGSTWLLAVLIAIDALIVAIYKGKP